MLLTISTNAMGGKKDLTLARDWSASSTSSHPFTPQACLAHTWTPDIRLWSSPPLQYFMRYLQVFPICIFNHCNNQWQSSTFIYTCLVLISFDMANKPSRCFYVKKLDKMTKLFFFHLAPFECLHISRTEYHSTHHIASSSYNAHSHNIRSSSIIHYIGCIVLYSHQNDNDLIVKKLTMDPPFYAPLMTVTCNAPSLINPFVCPTMVPLLLLEWANYLLDRRLSSIHHLILESC